MASQAHHTRILPFIPKNLLQQLLSPHIVLRMRLTVISLPQLILLRETLLDQPLRLRSMDLRLRAPTIARMLAHDLSRHLPDQRPEPIQAQRCPLQLRSLQAPHQRASNPRIRHRHLLVRKLLFEEKACIASLLLAHCCEVRIDPVAGAVTVELAPVVVPGFGAVEGFGDVVVALAVAGEVEELVGCVGGGGGD